MFKIKKGFLNGLEYFKWIVCNYRWYFNTPKPASTVVDLAVLSQAKGELSIPICAIGGINSENVAQVMEHNPDMISLISDIWKSKDIKAQSKIFSNLYKG